MRSEEECCGFVLKNDTIKLDNCADDKTNDFKISQKDYLKHQENIKYIWHTHVKPNHTIGLSSLDVELSHSINIPIISYNHVHDYWDMFDPNNPNPYPWLSNMYTFYNVTDINFYTGWKFDWCRSDCFALIRSYFLGMYSIDIGNFPRAHIDISKFPYPEFVCEWDELKNNFYQLDNVKELKANDIVEFCLLGGKSPNHLGVMINEYEFLHLPGKGFLSTVAKLGNNYKSRLGVKNGNYTIYRHQNFK